MDCLTYTQWIILGLSALCIGMSKTGIQGLMLCIIPFMAMAFGAKESTGVTLPMLCIADILAVAYYKRIADWKVILRLLPTALIGFLIAIGVDSLIPTEQFRKLLGWTLVIVMCVMLWNEFGKKDYPWMHTWWYGALFGLIGGFATMIGNAAGPVMAVYLLSMRKDKLQYVGINAWFFLVINLLKVPLQTFVWHNITWETFKLNLMMIPIIAIGSLIGIWTVKVVPELLFRRLIQAVTILSVILMVI